MATAGKIHNICDLIRFNFIDKILNICAGYKGLAGALKNNRLYIGMIFSFGKKLNPGFLR
jgi:hypothetical protein